MRERVFEGICKIIWDEQEGTIAVTDANEPYKAQELDYITNDLSKLADDYQLENADWYCGNHKDCLMAYKAPADDQENFWEEVCKIDPATPLTPTSPATETKDMPGEQQLQTSRPPRLDDVTEIEIEELFKVALRVPPYQRPYRWANKNIEFFWKDINACDLESGYDFGIIVLHKSDDGYDIVDGQQRIVTLAILLSSLSSTVADSFIDRITLQGKDSEKHIGYNYQWFSLHAGKLGNEERDRLVNKILKGTITVVVMDELAATLKFFDRMNTSGVALTNTDILKSHHLLALSDFKLSSCNPGIKERWRKLDPSLDSILDSCNDNEFKKWIVQKWESIDPNELNSLLAKICAFRMMADGKYPGDMKGIEDIEQFRGGLTTPDGCTGLDCSISDGEFFFYFVFSLDHEYRKLHNGSNPDNEPNSDAFEQAKKLQALLYRPIARDFFEILFLHIKMKRYPTDLHNRVVDMVFSWLVYLCIYYDRLSFGSIRNDAMAEDSVFRAITSCQSAEECLTYFCDNPIDRLKAEGYEDRADGNGLKYRIRRELRRIYG